MKLQSETRAAGVVQIDVLRASGAKERYIVKNMVVAGGETYAASRAIDGSTPAISHMAAGTGTTAVVSADTTLQAELAGRAAVTVSAAGNVAKYVAVFAPGVATGAWAELGLFNAAAAGLMTNRTVFGVKTKDTGDQITVTWTVRYTDAS